MIHFMELEKSQLYNQFDSKEVAENITKESRLTLTTTNCIVIGS